MLYAKSTHFVAPFCMNFAKCVHTALKTLLLLVTSKQQPPRRKLEKNTEFDIMQILLLFTADFRKQGEISWI